MTGTDVVFAGASLRDRVQYARTLAGAGNLIPKGLRDQRGDADPAKVLLVMETGVMLGLHPVAALSGVHIIEGKPTLSAQLMAALVRRAGHKLRVTVEGAGDSLRVTATLVRTDDPDYPFTAVWTVERARQAGLLGKDVWAKFRPQMMKARAISEVCIEGASDVLMGAYVPEELDAPVDADGSVIEGEIVDEHTGEVQPEPHVSHDALLRDEHDRAPFDAVVSDEWMQPFADAMRVEPAAARRDALRKLLHDMQASHVAGHRVDEGDGPTWGELVTEKGRQAADEAKAQAAA